MSPCIGRIIHLCYILTFPAHRKDLFSSGECVNGANIFPLRRFDNCLSREDFTMLISSFGNVTGFRPYSKSLLRSRWISYLYRMLSQSSIFGFFNTSPCYVLSPVSTRCLTWGSLSTASPFTVSGTTSVKIYLMCLYDGRTLVLKILSPLFPLWYQRYSNCRTFSARGASFYYSFLKTAPGHSPDLRKDLFSSGE